MYLFLFLMFSAWGELMYSETICFHLLRHNHPLKKDWTFLILRISSESSSRDKLLWGVSLHPFLSEHNSALSFFISIVNSSHCWVYCHLAVFSDSTIWTKWRCFCSNSSFCSNILLKLQHRISQHHRQYHHQGKNKNEEMWVRNVVLEKGQVP